MTPRERLKAGSSAHMPKPPKPFMLFEKPQAAVYEQTAQPKPWEEKQPSPYPGDGDNDGDGDTTHRYAPGEEIKLPPAPSPSSDTLSLRASLEAAAEVCRDPDAQQAMRAIEARLAEITQYMRAAGRGASKDMALKLGVLSHII